MNALQLPFNFDVDLMTKEIAQFSQADYYDIYNPSVTLKKLWAKHLIEPVGGPDQIPEFLPNEALHKCPYLLTVFETFLCRKETFRIHTLYAEAKIKAHRDTGYSFEQGKIRLHIPVVTNDEVLLSVNGERIHMKPGECWYCNFNEIHEVQNNGDCPRTHLIIDCMVNEWLKGVFETSQ